MTHQKWHPLRTSLKYFAVGVAAILPVWVWFTDTVGFVGKVSGSSMWPTFNPEGGRRQSDAVWVDRWTLRRRSPRLGEVVALSCPGEASSTMVKRVVALQGETVRSRSYRQRWVQVPAGHCWVEGDNPRGSRDSNLYGPVSLGLLLGRVSHVVLPWGRRGQVPHSLLPGQEERREPPHS